ncbi:Diacylglycerol O-acyltransferase 1 [Nymphon striatum]|nr:Diacylglycerol O-acyltransferase 1 [Nymphon striatum]
MIDQDGLVMPTSPASSNKMYDNEIDIFNNERKNRTTLKEKYSRMRRTVSISRADEIKHEEKQERALQPDKPCHYPQDSLLSSSSGYTNYRGLLNLCIILLVISNARAALENFIKYGILVDPIHLVNLVINNPTHLHWILLFLSINIYILIALSMEKLLAEIDLNSSFTNCYNFNESLQQIFVFKFRHHFGMDMMLRFRDVEEIRFFGNGGANFHIHEIAQGFPEDNQAEFHHGPHGNNWIMEKSACIFHACNLISLVTVPAIVVFVYDVDPVSASFTLGAVIIVFMKLISYAMVNSWCRASKQDTFRKRRMSFHHTTACTISTPKENSNNFTYYPNNLNVKDMYYFVFAPTLCYELNFPRSGRIRKRFLISRIVESLFLSQLIMGLIQQWMIPTIHNSMKPLQEMDVTRMIARLLKLAVPNICIWLIFFYWFFHSTMNISAELLKFSDRRFYNDWWNSESITYFWQNWNIPVHKWCLRHVYRPILRRKYSKLHAGFVVFFISAFFHEYLVSVPLKMFKLWAFGGMLAQLPLATVVSKSLVGKYANMAVWLSLIIGQPLAILMYYHDYYIINHT